jgi:hypothetical protein
VAAVAVAAVAAAVAAVAVAVVVVVVVKELEQNLSSDFRYYLVTPKTVKTYRHNNT